MTELDEILAAWGITATQVARAPSGLIQETWLVETAAGRRVAQKLHPVFGAAVLEDIEACTQHLSARGLATPRLLRTRSGTLGATDSTGRLWRLATYLDGWTVDRVSGPAMARTAAACVARFHAALVDLDHDFRFVRAGVHDTAAHLERLAAVSIGSGPRALAEQILTEAQHLNLAAFATLPRWNSHGDLKISNVLFAGESATPAAHALLDLDTLGRLPMAFELGDAWRSWCNPLGEDVEEARFDLELFAAAASGYAAAGRLTPEEIASLVPGVQTIALELAARFCIDAFEDRYFGWDSKRFPSRREHNRVRASGQLSLVRAIAAARAPAEAAIRRAFR